MEEREEAQAAKRVAVECEECGEREAKYRCPGCARRTCGLPCVRAHKARTACAGKRDRTAFVALGEYDDNVLVSDYNLLEETLRQADAAKRLRAPLGDDAKDWLPNPLRVMQRQARARSTSLLFLARGMSKRTSNTSNFNRKSNRICWRVEWVFEGTEVHLVDERANEDLSLERILDNHLSRDSKDVMLRHRLRNFCEKPISELQLLLLNEPCSAADKVYHRLRLKGKLRDELANKSIIEFPVIRVLLPRDVGKYTVAPCVTEEEDAVDGVIPTTSSEPEGVPFREEEIEEEEEDAVHGVIPTTSSEPEGVPFREEEIEEEEEDAVHGVIPTTSSEPEGVPFREEEIEEGEVIMA